MKTSTRWYRTPRIVLEMDGACAAWLDERCPLPNSDGYEVAWTHTRNTPRTPPTPEEWNAFALDLAEHGYSIDAKRWAEAWACPPPP